ncbi:MAG: oxidoreductase [Planctomycetaceae bacterium]|nr:oxidoreductase [Planctomycetaceae bacterium]
MDSPYLGLPLPVLLGYIVVGAPTLLVMILGASSIIDRPLDERTVSRVVQTGVVTGLLAAVAMLAWMLLEDRRFVDIRVGNWVEVGHGDGDSYHFYIKLIFDRLSVPFVILSFVLCGTIGAFANRYLHKDRGFNRFFMLYCLFLLGMVVTSVAGTIETLFAGWELVGLGSALLVAYFHDRPAPCRNGLHVWSIYRVGDAALLIAALLLHHLSGHGDFTHLITGGPWPLGETSIGANDAFIVGLLLLIAASAKSALVPFSGWLPRAMEGPTPSSAVFYGALSVHLGAFLLLRISPLIEQSSLLAGTIVCVGLTTALFAAFSGRAQTDVKSALSFASLTQVGLIVAEIGLGFRYIALIHILGHGCFRTLQFLRAPTLLHDYRVLENLLGSKLEHSIGIWGRVFSDRTRHWLYRLAAERGYLDAILLNVFVAPFLKVFRICDGLERRWTDLLSGGPSRDSDRVLPAQSTDEL